MASSQHPPRKADPASRSPTAGSSPVYDLLCIGFGPAQLATAVANRESSKQSRVLFVERKPAFSWRTSHLNLVRTRMENPFIYDLATIRNPRSAFSYVSYLLAKKRLVEFANSDRLQPLRIEFEEYLLWCEEQLKDDVRYNNEVVEITPEVRSDGPVRHWNVSIKDAEGQTYTVQARSIVAPSPSGRPEQKAQLLTSVNFLAGQRIVPIDEYPARRDDIRGGHNPRLNIAVVGSSQQSVEIVDDLLSCPRLGNVTFVTENESVTPLRIFGDSAAPEPRLCSIWAKPTSSQTTPIPESSELIQSIYSRAYEKQVSSKGEFTLRVALGTDTVEPCSKADIIVAEQALSKVPTNGIFHGIDAMVLGCRHKGESLEEVQFKRGAVDAGCKMWMMSAHCEGGRSLAKDIAIRAGEVMHALATTAHAEGRGGMSISARM